MTQTLVPSGLNRRQRRALAREAIGRPKNVRIDGRTLQHARSAFAKQLREKPADAKPAPVPGRGPIRRHGNLFVAAKRLIVP